MLTLTNVGYDNCIAHLEYIPLKAVVEPLVVGGCHLPKRWPFLAGKILSRTKEKNAAITAAIRVGFNVSTE